MKIVTILVMLVMVTATAAWTFTLRRLIEEEWREYKIRFHKNYTTQKSDLYHKSLFIKSRLDVALHNQRYERGEESYRQDVNVFADLPRHPRRT